MTFVTPVRFGRLVGVYGQDGLVPWRAGPVTQAKLAVALVADDPPPRAGRERPISAATWEIGRSWHLRTGRSFRRRMGDSRVLILPPKDPAPYTPAPASTTS